VKAGGAPGVADGPRPVGPRHRCRPRPHRSPGRRARSRPRRSRLSRRTPTPLLPQSPSMTTDHLYDTTALCSTRARGETSARGRSGRTRPALTPAHRQLPLPEATLYTARPVWNVGPLDPLHNVGPLDSLHSALWTLRQRQGDSPRCMVVIAAGDTRTTAHVAVVQGELAETTLHSHRSGRPLLAPSGP
jgi:hypothetical protein